jgi:hypothetical protein
MEVLFLRAHNSGPEAGLIALNAAGNSILKQGIA